MLLAFDTATELVTVGLHDGERPLASWELPEPMKHGEQLAPGIEWVLRQADVAVTDLTGIAVGVGPGPFTGLRVGLVAARTMGFALSIPVYGVCTLDVIAAEAIDKGLHGDFHVATDARRKEVYFATYHGSRRLEGPVVAKPADVATEQKVLGRGPLLYPNEFDNPGLPEYPDALVLADVVLQERFEILEPEPLYLRRPDAVEPGKPKRVS